MAQLHKVLVVGGGSIGERHARCFQTTRRTEVSLCEINDDLRGRLAEQYSLAKTYADFDEAVAARPDLAVICTPAHLHISMARKLIENGIPTLIEKPLSTTLDGVDELIAAADEKQIPVGVAYVMRNHPVINDFRNAIQSGRFGKPVEVIAVCGQHFPFYRPAYHETYYTNRATGGGAVQDALTHTLNFCEWIVGPITRLTADIDHLVLEGVDVEDTAHVVARHEGIMASYNLNQHQVRNETTVTIVCEKGIARYESHAWRWQWANEPETPWNDVTFEPLQRDELFIAQANRFLDTFEGKQPPLCPLTEARQTLQVNLAILDSADNRRWNDV